MRTLTEGALLSGTNVDDLGDYRPGLEAAKANGVRHPYVEAGIGKAEVRMLARSLGLADIAELPAQPCLSSRIETGIPVAAETLGLVHRIEKAASDWLEKRGTMPESVRCRVRRDGLVLELDPDSLSRIAATGDADLLPRRAEIARTAGQSEPPRLEAYRRGSAFLHENGAGPAR